MPQIYGVNTNFLGLGRHYSIRKDLAMLRGLTPHPRDGRLKGHFSRTPLTTLHGLAVLRALDLRHSQLQRVLLRLQSTCCCRR